MDDTDKKVSMGSTLTLKDNLDRCPICGGIAVLQKSRYGWCVMCQNLFKDYRLHIATAKHKTEREAEEAWHMLCAYEAEKIRRAEIAKGGAA